MTTPVPATWTPPPWRVLTLTCLLIVLLNAFDALATMEIVRRGGEEANPIVEPLLSHGQLAFFLWKMLLATACSGALALLSAKYRFAWRGFKLAVIVYASIAVLHVYLLHFAQRPS